MNDDVSSWAFLQNLFEEDKVENEGGGKSIVNLVRKAISVKSQRTVCDSSFEAFLRDICSTLPGSSESVSYLDLLKYVALDEDKEQKECVELENSIIEHVWVNVLAHSSAREHFSKKIRQEDVPSEAKPYLVLYSLGISADWFLYGGESSYYFVDQKTERDKLFTCLKRGYRSWQNNWYFYTKWSNLLSKIASRVLLSVDQLYPLTILLIVFRREWLYSVSRENNCYLDIKAKSLGEKLLPDKVNECLIYALYQHFEHADLSLNAKINEVMNRKILPLVSFHPFIARNLLNVEAYAKLYEPLEPNYANLEDKLDKWLASSSKRLLLDFCFPYTKVRENDVFMKSFEDIRLVDQIYLSFKSGKKFAQIYRKPYEGERFDFIQLKPAENSLKEYDDSRVIAYRNYLKPTGDFLLVQSEEKSDKQDSIKQAFSDFRHDLKDLTGNNSLDVLYKRMVASRDIYARVYALQQNLERLMAHPEDNCDLLVLLRADLREMDNDPLIERMEDRLPSIIAGIRDVVEEWDGGSSENLTKLEGELHRLASCLSQKICCDFDDYLRRLDSIRYAHDTLCDYIGLAGTTLKGQKTEFSLTQFLHEFIDFTHINARRVSLRFNPDGADYRVTYDKTILKIMLCALVDNAIKHGFVGEVIEHPTIQFFILPQEEFLVLKVANNGTPIDILTHDYKTRGIFKGVTGHTGLGGYLISKYAEQMGGYIDIPLQKEWNTEIDIYIKR